MARKRNPENKGLPNRWQHKHGAYYYQVPIGLEHLWNGKKLFRLGKTLPEAYQVWADRIALDARDIKNLGGLFDRYSIEVIPHKAPKTQQENIRYAEKLCRVFGYDTPVNALTPSHAYGYYNHSQAKTLARRELALLFHAYTKAVEWGIIDRSPFKGQVRLTGGNNVRDRYVEDWEVAEFLSLSQTAGSHSVAVIQAYTRLKLLTGMSQRDLLLLQPAKQFKEDGIHIQRHKVAGKTGLRTIYAWTPELREEIKAAMDARPVDISPWLFCNKRGQGYVNQEKGTASGWASIWQRYMQRALNETKITERFTDHDLRAKAGSDADSLEHARALLSHADSRITQKVYRRKPETVQPIHKLNRTKPSE